MSVTYSLTCINARLQGVVSTIDGGGGNGNLVLLADGGITLCTIQLAFPCGTVSGGILTFSGTLSGVASTTGTITSGQITNFAGTIVVSGLTVGIPGDPVDITITNGLNSTLVAAGQTVQLLGAQITGS